MMGHIRFRTAVVASAALAGTVFAGAAPAQAVAPSAFSCAHGRVRDVIGLIEIEGGGCAATPIAQLPSSSPAGATVVITLPGVNQFIRLLYSCASFDRRGDAVTGFGCQMIRPVPAWIEFAR